MATVDTRMLIAQMGVVAESEGPWKAKAALREMTKKGPSREDIHFLLRKIPVVPKLPGVVRAIESDANAALVAKGAFSKVAFKLLPEQQQKTNEVLTRQQNSAPDGAFFWRLVLSHESSGPHPMIKTEALRARADELFQTITDYCHVRNQARVCPETPTRPWNAECAWSEGHDDRQDARQAPLGEDTPISTFSV